MLILTNSPVVVATAIVVVVLATILGWLGIDYWLFRVSRRD